MTQRATVTLTKDTMQAALSDVMKICRTFWEAKDKPLEITIEPKKRERSALQNKALWGVAYEAICDANKIPKEWRGRYKQKLHTQFCGEYFGWKVFEMVNGARTREPVRTTTVNELGKVDVISTADCARFYEFIQALCAQATPSVYVPDPDPEWWKESGKEAA